MINAVYRCPSTEIELFMDKLRSIFSADKDFYDYSLVVGYMNIDLLGNPCDNEHYLDIMSENKYVCALNAPTRVKNTSCTCLDHISTLYISTV